MLQALCSVTYGQAYPPPAAAVVTLRDRPWASVPQTKASFFDVMRKTGEAQVEDREYISKLKSEAWRRRVTRIEEGKIFSPRKGISPKKAEKRMQLAL